METRGESVSSIFSISPYPVSLHFAPLRSPCFISNSCLPSLLPLSPQLISHSRFECLYLSPLPIFTFMPLRKTLSQRATLSKMFRYRSRHAISSTDCYISSRDLPLLPVSCSQFSSSSFFLFFMSSKICFLTVFPLLDPRPVGVKENSAWKKTKTIFLLLVPPIGRFSG